MEDDTTMAWLMEELKESVKDDFEEMLRWMLEKRGSDLRVVERGLRERGNRLVLKAFKEVLGSREVRDWKGGVR